jgi:phytoene synthase
MAAMSEHVVALALKHQAMASLSANGKTFYWASFFLGKDKAALAALLYSGCRQLDDIADNNNRDKIAIRRTLTTIQREISQTDAVDIHSASALFRHLIDVHGIDTAAVMTLIDGMIQDTSLIQLTDQQALDRYCYRVAGTVGLMMCSVLGVHNIKALPFAIDLGIAMQLTNISRDVLEDAGVGRRYLPVDVAVESLACASAGSRAEVARMIDLQLKRAELFYESGIAGLTYLPRGSRVAIYLAAILYRAIGRQLRQSGCPWWRGRTVISTRQKLLMTLSALPVLCSLTLKATAAPEQGHDRMLHVHLAGLPYADT